MAKPVRAPRSHRRPVRRNERSLRHRVVPMVERFEDRTLLATFNVTEFNDVVNPNDGKWSLREAVNEANSNNEADTIDLQDGFYRLTQGTLTLTKGTVTINGIRPTDSSGSTISGNSAFRVLQVEANVNATINGVTIYDGRDGFGGAGIFNSGTLNLNSVRVSQNVAQPNKAGANQPAADAYGGGINNTDTGVLTMQDCVVEDNIARGGEGRDGAVLTRVALFGVPTSASQPGAGGNGWGGGILNGGRLELRNTVIADNRADGGAGGTSPSEVAFWGLSLGLQSTGGDGRGGGLVNYASTTPGRPPGTTEIDAVSIFDGNIARGGAGGSYAGGTTEAAGRGGGIYVHSGSVTVRGTLRNNNAFGGRGASGDFLYLSTGGGTGSPGGPAEGGGVYVLAGSIAFDAATLSTNTAQGGNGGVGGAGAAGVTRSGTYYIRDIGDKGNPGTQGGWAGPGGAGGYGSGVEEESSRRVEPLRPRAAPGWRTRRKAGSAALVGVGETAEQGSTSRFHGTRLQEWIRAIQR